MNKLTGILLGSMMLLGPIAASAQTTVSASAQVQALLTQIQNLQTQLQSLKTAQAQVQSQATTVAGTLQLIRSLGQGMSGSDVSTLQAILAADPSIYPSGSITGFYGKLTADAVKKFQKKHGLDSLGNVGPKTLKKLNEVIRELGLQDDNATSTEHRQDGDKKLCIPPGHMIAPGWLKHNERPVPSQLIPLCNKRHGEHEDDNDENHGSGSGTSTPTLSTNASASVVVGGNIFDVAHLNNGNTPTGTITFQVYGPSDTTCSTPLVPAPSSASVNGNGNYNSGNYTTTQVGTYKFIANYSGDLKNTSVHTNCNDAGESVSVTAVQDITAPILSSIVTTPLATTTTVTWTTNENSTSKVWFGTTNPLVLGSSTVVSSNTQVTTHSLLLSGLTASTVYNYVVVSTDASGNTATSSQSSFITLSSI